MTIPAQPNVKFVNAPDYREAYANSVQIRVNVWDFFSVFGTMQQSSETQVELRHFQGIYLSPQQAKALMSLLQQNAGPTMRPPSARCSLKRARPAALCTDACAVAARADVKSQLRPGRSEWASRLLLFALIFAALMLCTPRCCAFLTSGMRRATTFRRRGICTSRVR